MEKKEASFTHDLMQENVGVPPSELPEHIREAVNHIGSKLMRVAPDHARPAVITLLAAALVGADWIEKETAKAGGKSAIDRQFKEWQAGHRPKSVKERCDDYPHCPCGALEGSCGPIDKSKLN